ncbi:hypothetical protein CHS0354_027406 [Potamilus streckersoni]|uniref:2,3,4,5-tetrahydropyridine-2,6-dicarboxylate N-succinyltransferase n=1 Tax=Potamilus streckersoni TaxID=2493646 RepID=A0AAE0SQ52_9BIVA|nr:hypothetical protein CHS0354_027406 [Potamilus streckersoni]
MIFGLGLAFLNSRQEIIAVHYPNPLCEGDSAYDLINKHRFFDLPEGLSQLSEQKLAQIIAEIGTEAISAHFSEWIHYLAALKSAKLQSRSIVLWYDKNDSPPADTAEGPNMVEGRISAGVFVGSGSDLGGGCSTMGTLSGGGNIIISVGKNCLIGANAGLGIPLGDNCVIESGLYITSGSVISVLDKDRTEVGKVKAAQLAGQNDLLFRRHSQTGRIECLTKKNNVELNHELHHFN